MTWNERLTSFMREDRARIVSQIDLFSLGRHRVIDGGERDVTDETLKRLHCQLAEIESIMTDAGVSLDA